MCSLGISRVGTFFYLLHLRIVLNVMCLRWSKLPHFHISFYLKITQNVFFVPVFHFEFTQLLNDPGVKKRPRAQTPLQGKEIPNSTRPQPCRGWARGCTPALSKVGSVKSSPRRGGITSPALGKCSQVTPTALRKPRSETPLPWDPNGRNTQLFLLLYEEGWTCFLGECEKGRKTANCTRGHITGCSCIAGVNFPLSHHRYASHGSVSKTS